MVHHPGRRDRGPGSNQWADKPPLPPRAPTATATGVADPFDDPLQDEQWPYELPPFVEDDPARLHDEPPVLRTPKGAQAQPLPADLVDPKDAKSVKVGPMLFTRHAEERRSEMGVSRVRLLQTIANPQEVRTQNTHYKGLTEVKSGPYVAYLSEDRRRVITIVWRTRDRTWGRGDGVPPDCVEAHLRTRCGIPGAPGTDAAVKQATEGNGV